MMRRGKSRVGRPTGGSRLGRDRILERAAARIDSGRALTVRGLSRDLGVDPMAIYHYYRNRRALMEALVMRRMEGIHKPDPVGDWRAEVTALARSYLALLARSAGLLEVLLSMAGVAKGPVQLFRERFRTAVPHLGVHREQAAIDLLVDYLHGFALALRQSGDTSLRLSDADAALHLYLDALGGGTGQAAGRRTPKRRARRKS